MIRPVDSSRDAADIASIYNYFIHETTITFETEPMSAADMGQRICHYTEAYPWLVAEESGQVVAYAYATKFRERAAYRHTCEVSVYCHHQHSGSGYGLALIKQLLEELKLMPECYTAMAVITGGNQRSRDFFRRLGFEQCGYLKNVGRKHGQWIDTYDYMLALKDYDAIND